MGILFIAGAIVAAVVGIMTMAVSEPYDKNDLYKLYK